MKKALTVLFAATVLLYGVMVPGAAFSQENEEEVMYSYGVVKTATGEQITIEEVTYDENTDEETVEEVVYYVSPAVELENVKAVTDIKEADEIDIEYIEKDGKKQASYIYVYAGGEEEWE